MKGFKLITPDQQEIHFEYYLTEAPVTAKAFHTILPFTKTFYHARVSGQEIWTDNVPPLDIIQENASVFTTAGEVVFGPAKPARTKTANCFGIYYGEGKGVDAANIFAKVVAADFKKLQELGESIWRNGAVEITLEAIL